MSTFAQTNQTLLAAILENARAIADSRSVTMVDALRDMSTDWELAYSIADENQPPTADLIAWSQYDENESLMVDAVDYIAATVGFDETEHDDAYVAGTAFMLAAGERVMAIVRSMLRDDCAM